jgi:hypothetical protein
MSGLVHHLHMLESKRRAKAKVAQLEQQTAEKNAKAGPLMIGKERGKRMEQ